MFLCVDSEKLPREPSVGQLVEMMQYFSEKCLFSHWQRFQLCTTVGNSCGQKYINKWHKLETLYSSSQPANCAICKCSGIVLFNSVTLQ